MALSFRDCEVHAHLCLPRLRHRHGHLQRRPALRRLVGFAHPGGGGRDEGHRQGVVSAEDQRRDDRHLQGFGRRGDGIRVVDRIGQLRGRQQRPVGVHGPGFKHRDTETDVHDHVRLPRQVQSHRDVRERPDLRLLVGFGRLRSSSPGLCRTRPIPFVRCSSRSARRRACGSTCIAARPCFREDQGQVRRHGNMHGGTRPRPRELRGGFIKARTWQEHPCRRLQRPWPVPALE